MEQGGVSRPQETIKTKKKGKEKERSGDYIDLMPSSIATSIDEYDFV